jgi:hypothetical protein
MRAAMVGAYRQRLLARPAVQKALTGEGLTVR